MLTSQPCRSCLSIYYHYNVFLKVLTLFIASFFKNNMRERGRKQARRELRIVELGKTQKSKRWKSRTRVGGQKFREGTRYCAEGKGQTSGQANTQTTIHTPWSSSLSKTDGPSDNIQVVREVLERLMLTQNVWSKCGLNAIETWSTDNPN